MKIQAEAIDLIDEQRILISMITDTSFIKTILPVAEPEHFVNPFSQKLFLWIKEYFSEYGVAPQRQIADIFTSKKVGMSSEEIELFELFLSTLNQHYEEGYNEQYFADKALRYLKRRSLEVHADRIKSLLSLDQIEEAENLQVNFKKVSRAFGQAVDPLGEDFIERVFNRKDSDQLLKPPGKLGELTGWFCRNWLTVIQGPYKSGKCVKFDAEILMDDGSLKTIEEVVRNGCRNVVSMSEEDKKFRKSTVADFIDNGIKPCYRLTTKSGRFVDVTAIHPFLTVEGWKRLEDLVLGEPIAIPRSLPFFGNNVWPSHKNRLLAYVLAIGSLRGPIYFAKREDDLIEDIAQCCDGMGDELKRTQGNEWWWTIARKNKTRRVKAHTRLWLDELGIPKDARNSDKQIPPEVFTLSRECIGEFLNILFTCRGTMYEKNNECRIEYRTDNERMVRQIGTLLTRFGILFSISHQEKNQKKHYSLVIRVKDSVIKFINEIGFSFDKQTTSLSFKNLFESESRRLAKCRENFPLEYIVKLRGRDDGWPLELRLHKKRAISRDKLRVMALRGNWQDVLIDCDSDITWDRVKTVDYIGEYQTYDLSIDQDHNFVANNMLVHNTHWFQLLREVALRNGLKTLDINLEMSEEELAMRMYKGFTGLPEESDEITEIRWPVFDCMQNQTGLCSFPHRRTNTVRLYSPEGRRPLPTDKDLPEGYRACDVCRRNAEWYGNYTEEIWFETLTKNSFLDKESVLRKANAIKRQYGSLMRFKCYPRGSINVDDIRRLLDILEYSEGFIPDVINVDYPKIMAPENDSKSFNEEGQLDRTMLALAGLATERHCIINTASQVNREAIRRGKSRVGDASQSTRAIYAHAALVIGISQTEEEEVFNAKRFNVILGRFKQANSMVEARVLQQFQVGQPYVDSEYARANWGSGNGNNSDEERKSKRRMDMEE